MSTSPSQPARESLINLHKVLNYLCIKLTSFLVLAAFTIMAACAIWESRIPATMIAPFQLPKVELPFSGEIVADAVQDGLESVRNEIEEDKQDTGLRSSETGLPDLRNMLVPAFDIQTPPRFTVEVKGVSYEQVLSFVRAVRGNETKVSGDVMLREDGKFVLIARASNAGPWESIECPRTTEGLKEASKDLAVKILATQQPTLAGVALLKDGDVDQGLAMLNRARSMKPNDSSLKLNLCMGFAANRRYEDAIDCYRDVLKMNPSSPEQVLEYIAQAYYLEGERRVAIDLYDDLAHKQSYRDALLGLGEALDDNGRPNEALQAYNEFLAGERLDRNLAIAHVKRSAAFAHLGMHQEALADYEEALQYAPRDLLILVHRGVELAQSGDKNAGIAQLQSVVDENMTADSAPFAMLQLGVLLQKNGEWSLAGDLFHEATKRRPGYVEAHLKLADVFAHQGRRSEAVAEYGIVARLSASELDRGNSQVLAHMWLGNTLRDQKNDAGAASAYREALRLQPDYGAAHNELGFVLERQGRLPNAIGEYRAALKAAKTATFGETEWIAVAHHRLGMALLREGRAHWVEGVAELRKALELDANDAEAYLSLANAFYEEGDYLEAASEYEQAVKINPQYVAAHNRFGFVPDSHSHDPRLESAVEPPVMTSTSISSSPMNSGPGLRRSR